MKIDEENVGKPKLSYEKDKSWAHVILHRWYLWIPPILWLIFVPRLGETVWRNADMYLAGFYILFLLYTSGIDYFKNKTQKFIGNNVFTTWDSYYRRAGNYAVILGGAIKAFGFYTKGGSEGTYVLPIGAINMLGEQGAGTVRFEKIEFYQYPKSVRDLHKDIKLKTPYYFGYVDETQYPELARMEAVAMKEELLLTNEALTKIEEILNRSGTWIEDEVSRSARIQERSKGKKGFWGKTKDTFSKSDDDY